MTNLIFFSALSLISLALPIPLSFHCSSLHLKSLALIFMRHSKFSSPEVVATCARETCKIIIWLRVWRNSNDANDRVKMRASGWFCTVQSCQQARKVYTTLLIYLKNSIFLDYLQYFEHLHLRIQHRASFPLLQQQQLELLLRLVLLLQLSRPLSLCIKNLVSFTNSLND